MARIRVPFRFAIYGPRGRRVPQTWTVVSETSVEAHEMSRADADGVLSCTTRRGRFEALLFDGIVHVPAALVGGSADPGSAHVLDAAVDAALRGEGGLLESFVFGPFDLLRVGDAVRRTSVRETLPSDEDRRRAHAETVASHLILVDGMPFTSRYEPALGARGGGWHWTDVATPPSAGELPGWCRHEPEFAGAPLGDVLGDLDRVAWRMDNERDCVARAVARIGKVAGDWSAFPIGRDDMRLEVAKLTARLAASEVPGGPDLRDVAGEVGDVLREARLRLFEDGRPWRAEELGKADEDLAQAAIVARARVRIAMPDADLEALSFA